MTRDSEGFEPGAEVGDLSGESGEGVGVVAVMAVFVDEVPGSGMVGDLSPAGPARQTGDVVAAHHQIHGAARHGDTAAVNKLSVHTPCPVGPPRGVMDLPDDLQPHRMAHRTRRRRPP